MIYNITYVTGQQKERMAKCLCGTNMTWLLQKDLFQARNQDFMWGGGGANEAKVDQITEMYFLLSDPFI